MTAKRTTTRRPGRWAARAAAGALLVTIAALTPVAMAAADRSQRSDGAGAKAFGQTLKGITGFFSTCNPTSVQCFTYAVNARVLTEHVGRRHYEDALVWVAGYAIHSANGVPIPSPQPVMDSGYDLSKPPRQGGLPAHVQIHGAKEGRVTASLTVWSPDHSKSQKIVVDLTIDAGTIHSAVKPVTSAFSALCASHTAAGQSTDVVSDDAPTSGTMTVDGVALDPVPTKFAAARVHTRRSTGTCSR